MQKFQPICAKVPACGPPARSEWTRPGRRSLLENPYFVDPNGATNFCSTFCSHFCSLFCSSFCSRFCSNRSKLLHTLLLNAVLFSYETLLKLLLKFCSIFCSHFCSHFCALTSLGPCSVGSLCVGPLLGHPCWRLSSLRDCPTRIKASISDPACRPTTCNCSRSVEKSHLEKCIFVNARFCSSRTFYH